MGWSSVSASRALARKTRVDNTEKGTRVGPRCMKRAWWTAASSGPFEFRFSLSSTPTLLKAKMRPIQSRHPNHCDGSDGHCRPSRCGGPVHVRKVKCRLHLTHKGSQFFEPDGYRHSVACLPDRWPYLGVRRSQFCSFDAARAVRHRTFRRRAGVEGFLGRLPTVRTGLNYRSEGVEIGKIRRKTVT